MIASIFHHWFFHPLHGNGYQFWSGIAGSFLTSLPGWLVAMMVFCRHRNCHEKGCLAWLRTHNHPDHGWPTCKRHWQSTPDHIARVSDGGE